MDDAQELGAAVAVQAFKTFSLDLLRAVRRFNDKRRMLRVGRALSAELDELVERGLPTFGSWDCGTIGHVACNHGLEPSVERQLAADNTANALERFNRFATHSSDPRETIEQCVGRFAEMDEILVWILRSGLHLQAMANDARSTVLPSYKIAAAQYNKFLDEYEDLCAKVARAVRAVGPRKVFFRL